MSAAAPEIVGRPTELDAFGRILDALETDGTAAAIALVGEPGIGKTRLLAELASLADARGHLVLSGSASELERDLPFWVFVDALDEFASGLDPERLGRLDAQTRVEIAHVFPGLSRLGTGGGTALQNERYRTHSAVRDLLEVLAAGTSLVLILDDLHWADSGTVELIGALLRRRPAAPVLLAMAIRPRQVPERLLAAFERAHRSGRLARHELGALSLPETRLLLGSSVELHAAAAVHEESGGNPFYAEQLARALDRSSAAAAVVAADVSLAGAYVPPAVAAALSEELALLSDGARLALDGAAVAGDPFEPELMAAAAGVGEASAFAALDELLRLDLVRHTDVPRRFRFRHPLVRRAIYDASPGGWRLGAHQRSAEVLTARGASAPAVAHHVERSARHGDGSAIAVLREAGDAAVQRAPATAARWFRAALRTLDEAAPADERAELLTALAGAQAATGQFEGARAALLEAIELLPADANERGVQLTAGCAGIEQLLGRHDEAHARLVAALEGLADPDSRDAAALMITLAMDAFYRQARRDSREWGARALAVARPLGDEAMIAAASAALALFCAFEGALDEARLHRSEAAALVDAMPDEQLAIRLDAIAYLTGAEAYMDLFRESDGHGRRGLAVARATGQGLLVPMLTQALATALCAQGRFGEGAELMDGAIEASRLAGNDQTLAWDLLNRAFVDVHRGEMISAMAAAEESMDLTRDFADGFLSTHAGVMLAIARLENGEPAKAVELFLSAGGGESMHLMPGGWCAKYLDLLTRGCLLIGKPDDAQRVAEHAKAVADATGLGMATAWALRASAAVALEQDEAAAAASEALSSAALCESAGAPFEAAVSHALAGRAFARAGDGARAVAELQHAVTVFEECGAQRYRLDAERELRKLGHAVHRRTQPGKADEHGIASLSARELELARLVVDRKTNPEIAAALFLSPKTVESHLRNIFRKLDVSSRVELARVVERADRAG